MVTNCPKSRFDWHRYYYSNEMMKPWLAFQRFYSTSRHKLLKRRNVSYYSLHVDLQHHKKFIKDFFVSVGWIFCSKNQKCHLLGRILNIVLVLLSNVDNFQWRLIICCNENWCLQDHVLSCYFVAHRRNVFARCLYVSRKKKAKKSERNKRRKITAEFRHLYLNSSSL